MHKKMDRKNDAISCSEALVCIGIVFLRIADDYEKYGK